MAGTVPSAFGNPNGISTNGRSFYARARVLVRKPMGLGVCVRVAGTLRQGERPQRLGSPRFLAGGLGEAGHHRLPTEEPVGRLSTADVYDAGRKHCGGESVQRLAGIGA